MYAEKLCFSFNEIIQKRKRRWIINIMFIKREHIISTFSPKLTKYWTNFAMAYSCNAFKMGDRWFVKRTFFNSHEKFNQIIDYLPLSGFSRYSIFICFYLKVIHYNHFYPYNSFNIEDRQSVKILFFCCWRRIDPLG